MNKLIAVAVAAFFAVSVNSFAQAPKAPEKAPAATAAAVKSETKAPETKAAAKSQKKGKKAAPKAEVTGGARAETVKK